MDVNTVNGNCNLILLTDIEIRKSWMALQNEKKPIDDKQEFGPIFARLYSLFASRSGKHKAVYSKILEDMVSMNPSSILEMGSGPGIAAAIIAQKLPGTKITCVDPSTTMVKIANQRFEELSLAPRVKSELGESSKFVTTEKFDLIFSSLSYHHWRNGKQDLQELARKYLPAGTLIIYENFIQNEDGAKSVKHHHGIGLKDIESIEIPGFRKAYEIEGKLVRVKFSNI